MKILIEKTGKEIDKKFSGNVIDLLGELGENPVGVLVVRNGELLNEEDELSDDDYIKILSVVSGG